ncbi:MAG: T9SS type A sorting domain-containing protein, partial [candidate division WOR-3 bacterium]
WYDTAAAAGATRAIINNLDVRMIAPNGDSFKGNVYANGQSVRNPTQRYDSIDVLECLRINAPNTGNWTLRVMARNVVTRPQRYAVVLTGGFPLVGITEELVGGVRPTEMALVYGPNPSRIGGSKVRFYAPDVNKRYTLKLYDASGSLLKTLFDARLKTRGWQNINWNGCDDNNRQIPQGVYFYVLENEDKRLSYKVILVR